MKSALLICFVTMWIVCLVFVPPILVFALIGYGSD
jgi:hypothetical protein